MIRFLADADLNEGIVSGCLRKEPTMDLLSANDAGLQKVPDPEVLRIAAEQERILVTHDFKTMPEHFGQFLQETGLSPGVLLARSSTSNRQDVKVRTFTGVLGVLGQWLLIVRRAGAVAADLRLPGA
jgi:hypothetical protein